LLIVDRCLLIADVQQLIGTVNSLECAGPAALWSAPALRHFPLLRINFSLAANSPPKRCGHSPIPKQ
jgi:hypothetical protein